MKKRNNKIIVLAIAGIIFVVLLGIFILNYSKDDYSFSILERSWINDNTKNVQDVSIYNDVPIFGKAGKGVAFDFLSDFTASYGIDFNKDSYSVKDDAKSLKNTAFRIVSGSTNLTEDDILIYEDGYVLVSPKDTSIDRISDIHDMTLGILANDMNEISNYLSSTSLLTYVQKQDIDEIIAAFDNEEIEYAIIPNCAYLDEILAAKLNVLYHFKDITQKYVLTIKNNNTFRNILKKYYLKYKLDNQFLSYKENFLNEFFASKEISEVDRMGYNSASYNFGYITYMPFENKENNEFIGTLSRYLGGFEDLFDVDFKLISYSSVADLKKALSSGELDLAFANFNGSGLNIDTIYTISPFKEEYVVLSENTFAIDSVKGLKNREVLTIKDSYIHNYLTTSGITATVYNNTDDLLRGIKKDSVIVIDRDTYNYYKIRKFENYHELYHDVLPNEYRFLIRDVNKNTIFAEMFKYYVSTVDYDEIRYDVGSNYGNYSMSAFIAFVASVIVIILIAVGISLIRKGHKKESILTNNDKLKYIDMMTSLKNRAYLNYKIKEWDENTTYPQAFVVVDLNNIKDINDSHGHEEGDLVIKKAASVLIVCQEPNTDIIRTDGTEFLIYMVGYDEKDIVSYTRKIYKELKELPYGYGATIGYSLITDDVKTVDDAINEATLDMRKKKQKADDNE